jgi:hypothetical protein
MADLKVVSREYKVMLRASRFAGDEGRLLETAGAFWREAGEAFAGVVGDVGGNLSNVQARRFIRFYDTPRRDLKANAYIFRERVDLDGMLREMTLKFRHPDRYLAQDRDMGAVAGAHARTKFEEDIKPPFQSLYSHSTTQRIASTKTLDTLKDLDHLYPGTRPTLERLKDTPIEIPNNRLTAREFVVGGAEMELGKSRNVKAECALIVWYDDGDPSKSESPVVVEFSFRYGDAHENYGGGSARRAYETFNVLQHGLTDWVDKTFQTKTAFAYGNEP